MATNKVSPLGEILMDAARDMNKRYLAGESLAPVEAETAARIAAAYQPKLCKGGCGETTTQPDGMCRRCNREIRGPFSYGEDD